VGSGEARRTCSYPFSALPLLLTDTSLAAIELLSSSTAWPMRVFFLIRVFSIELTALTLQMLGCHPLLLDASCSIELAGSSDFASDVQDHLAVYSVRFTSFSTISCIDTLSPPLSSTNTHVNRSKQSLPHRRLLPSSLPPLPSSLSARPEANMLSGSSASPAASSSSSSTSIPSSAPAAPSSHNFAPSPSLPHRSKSSLNSSASKPMHSLRLSDRRGSGQNDTRSLVSRFVSRGGRT
jgi:hypothetical protein